MVADKQSSRLTLDQYREMERASDVRHEFVDGHVYLMVGGTRLHSELGISVVEALRHVAKQGKCQVYNSDMRVRLSDTIIVYPDATVTCDERDSVNGDDDEIAFPRLIVEVLSPTTERIDRGRKLRDYQACPSIEEYVLVNTTYQAVETYVRSGTTWSYRRFEDGKDVELQSLGAKVSLADLYGRTNVPTEPQD